MAIAAVGMQYPEFLYRPSPKNRPFVSLDQLKKHDTELEVPYFEWKVTKCNVYMSEIIKKEKDKDFSLSRTK